MTMTKHHVTSSLVLLAALLMATTFATSQVRYRLAAGMSTDWITSDNPAVYRITGQQNNPDPNQAFGGALDGMQMGWGIRLYADLDKQKKFRVPIGIDYYGFSGVQAFTAETFSLRIRHDVDVFTGLIGFEYSFVEFPLAFARAFAGVEVRPLWVAPNSINQIERTITPSGIVENNRTYSGKDGAFRVGGMVRLGIEGELYYPVFLNTSVGYGVMNLLNRDERSTANDGRGELLTPQRLNENGERMLSHVNFTFMIQVRL